MPAERVETLVIGGGQAGLAMSHRLKQRGLSHLVLERGRIAERWRSERWDGLNFQFPNWSVRLPDFRLSAYRSRCASRRQARSSHFIDAYAAFVAPPIRCGVEVTRLSHRDGARLHRRDVGGRDRGRQRRRRHRPLSARRCMPDLLRDETGLFQVHASRYANPEQLPHGAVLVVGAGASGAQIAEELHRAGRRVFLVGRPAHPPAAPLSRPRSDLVVRARSGCST